MKSAADTNKSYLTIFLCLLLAAFEGIDLQAAGLAVPQIKTEFALAASQLGLFTAASSIGVLFGAIGGGRIADRFGRRVTLILAIALFGLFSIATALSSSFEMLVITRFFTGLGLGAAIPNLVALVSENSPPHRKARGVAIMYAGFPLGGGTASAIMAAVATPGSAINGVLTTLGLNAGDWRSIFYVGGLAPLIAVPIISLVLPDSMEFASVKTEKATGVSWWQVVFGDNRTFNTILLWVSFFTTLLVLYLLLNWLPTLMNSRGFARSDAFLMQLAFNVVGMTGSIAAGFLMDGSWRKLTVPIMYGGTVLFLILTSIMPTEVSLAIFNIAFVGFFVSGTQGLLYGIAPRCYGTTIRGTGVGAAVCVGRVGSVVGPLFAAGLVGAGRTPAQVLMAIVPLAVIGGVTALMLTARVRMATPEEIARTLPEAV